ncbi:hypothetical protein AN928_15115 [Pseudomonas aeruginosa]|nr:hypothetical protein AN929_15585 [Pseudomonas aeruginosa]KZM05739.1 hypothetical protein AN928_15115 [Pseudomonas aeruginosa]KZM12737.1 hypothetical protein AN930_14395 [Pseudomonas aeruginosa]PCK41329.1 hypothetical protein A2J14_26490 [Pseudomonas aeruginosa]PCK55800.1 hypothetical protein A2J11_16245 [Pseudomonas aeruginosa]
MICFGCELAQRRVLRLEPVPLFPSIIACLAERPKFGAIAAMLSKQAVDLVQHGEDGLWVGGGIE